MEENEVVVETVETQKPQGEVKEPITEVKKPNPVEVLREVAKLTGINLFDEGAEPFKQKWNEQLETNKTLNGNVEDLTKREKELLKKEADYQVKIEALGLGFTPDSLDEVLALAKVHAKDQPITVGLKAVKEKYGSVFATQPNVGLQHNDLQGDKPNIPRTEQEKYLANSKAYQQWQKMQGQK